MMQDRYIVSKDEDFELGSNEVLKNFLGIKDRKTIERLEAQELFFA